MTGAQAGRNAVENNFLDVAQLEDFAHRAKVGTGEERQKVIRDMVDTNVRQQDEIKEVCAKSPQQCQQRYGYLLDEWELFDDTIKRLAKDKSLPDDFRDYMPAVYMSDVDAGGIVAEHGWTKRFEAMGFDADTARVMAATLPAVVSSVGGGKGGKLGGKGAASKQTTHFNKEPDRYKPNKDAVENMTAIFERPGFGGEIKNNSQRTSQHYHGMTVYKANDDIGGYIKKGDNFYLDKRHKDHIEVFDRHGNFKVVLNLDGSINDSKTMAAKGRRLK
ncbi:VENN motif pre-toxin domain-containing protein [Achromobacter xylosoxidans]|uniref:VENN motif pre-toxin domain-containing protein n=1 Tax=Alcaligenes xylosoxydans xylosoxydans TaxID=85698 RepID=UPI0038FCDFF7